MHVAKEPRGFALDRLFSICYLCYWDLIPKEYCRFSRVSALFAHKYPYAPLVILYFTVTDMGRGGGGLYFILYVFLNILDFIE